MGDSPVRKTYPPTTITYIPAHKERKRVFQREGEEKWVIKQNAPDEMGSVFTDIPWPETEVGGEVELNDACGIVEK